MRSHGALPLSPAFRIGARSPPASAFLSSLDVILLFSQGQIQGKRYFEIDIDSHTYNFVARKGLHTFRTYLMSMIFDCALTIQARRPGAATLLPPERRALSSKGRNLEIWKHLHRPPEGGGSLIPTPGASDDAPPLSFPQGNSPEQLQEQILCCSRLYYFDFGRERRLLSSNAGGEPAGPQGQSDRQSDIGIRRDGEDREAGAARP